MITNLKVQIEEDKRIEKSLKEHLEERGRIIGNLEAEIVTLRNDLQKKNMQNNSKFWMTLSTVKSLTMTS
jgi:hypothetical protein